MQQKAGAPIWNDTKLYEGEAQACVLIHDKNVSSERKRRTATEGCALDCRDDGLLHIDDAQMLSLSGENSIPPGHRRIGHIAEVCARAKGRPLSPQDHNPVVFIDLVESPRQLCSYLYRESVSLLGSIQRDHGDATATMKLHDVR